MKPDTCFVVFNCGGEWDHYQDYTGQCTEYSRLKIGWTNK